MLYVRENVTAEVEIKRSRRNASFVIEPGFGFIIGSPFIRNQPANYSTNSNYSSPEPGVNHTFTAGAFFTMQTVYHFLSVVPSVKRQSADITK